MRFYIKTLAGDVIVVRDFEASWTIWELKRRIYEQTEIPIELQRLIFAGRVLDNQLTISDSNAESETTFHVVINAPQPTFAANSYDLSKPPRNIGANPIELQYTVASVPSGSRPRGKFRIDSYLSTTPSYQDLYLKIWSWANQSDGNPKRKKTARELKYQRLIENILQNKRYLDFEPPPKGWKKAARKVLPETLTKCGYNEAEIGFVKATKIFDIVDAIAYIKTRRIELIKPSSDLTPLFINHDDVVAGSIFPFFTLLDRMRFSLTCKSFNKIARQPVIWKHLCLLHDRAHVTDKHFVNILNHYGDCIYALSIQKCLKMTSKSIIQIGEKCPNLRILNAADNIFFNEDEQNAVFSQALKLQVVNLSITNNPTPKPIGRIDSLKDLKELNLAGRVQPFDHIIANVNLKVLDIRHCTGDLRIDCPQLEQLIVDKQHSHPKHTMTRTALRFVSYGASDPQSFVAINQLADGPDRYFVLNSNA